MKIAQVAPLTEAVPPKLYGGTERIVSYLTDQLAELGHEVTLFASGDSVTKATLEPVWPCALRLDSSMRDYLAPHIVMLEQVARRSDEFDIVHLHVDYLGYPILQRTNTPFLATLHGRLDLPELAPLYEMFDEVPVVSISDSQREPLPHAAYIATVPHGIPARLLLPGFGLAAISRFSAASRRKRRRTPPSVSPRQPRYCSRSRPRSTMSTDSTSLSALSRCSAPPMSSSSARSPMTKKASFSATRRDCFFPSH